MSDADLNNMSIEDLIKFADDKVLPDAIGENQAGMVDEEDEFDMNSLSPEDLLAMAEGKEPENVPSASEAEPEAEGASEEELMAMLENTIGEDELGADDEVDMEVAKAIDKMKLRQLANRIATLAPPKLFPSRKDEIYYFLSSMVGQSLKIQIEDANKKCGFIGEALKGLETFMITEVGMSLEEAEIILKLFEGFSQATVDESESRDRIHQNFKFGWQQTLKVLKRDIQKLEKNSKERSKPFWVVMKFYESLSRAYGLCRAQDDMKRFKEEYGIEVSKEQKRDIVNAFEDLVEMSKFFGVRKLSYINRKEAFEAVGSLGLDAILRALRERQMKGIGRA